MGGANSQPNQQNSGGTPARRPASFRFHISSDYGEGRDVQKTIMDAVLDAGFGEHDVFAIKLALEEALINAIKHGNKLDPAKSVRINASISPQMVEIDVEDEGAGFTRSSVPDPTLEENLEKTSGRGILLIESYMTHAEWSKNGRKLHMTKKREDSVANPA
jgi:serine/threonine-protein kinase RsbW